MNTPRVIIVEQPALKAMHFRHELEAIPTGSILGVNSTNEHKTYPTIKVLNYTGSVCIVTSCVTSVIPYR